MVASGANGEFVNGDNILEVSDLTKIADANISHNIKGQSLGFSEEEKVMEFLSEYNQEDYVNNQLNLRKVEAIDPEIREIVTEFLASSDYLTGLTSVFGNTGSVDKADTLLHQWSQGESFPLVKIVNLEEIEAKGAYSEENQTIYLSYSLIKQDISEIVSVYLEELGHYLDPTFRISFVAKKIMAWNPAKTQWKNK